MKRHIKSMFNKNENSLQQEYSEEEHEQENKNQLVSGERKPTLKSKALFYLIRPSSLTKSILAAQQQQPCNQPF